MKRQRQAQEEGYLVLPLEVYCHILSFIPRYDLDTYLALLSVEKSAVAYMRPLMGNLVFSQLSYMIGHQHTEKMPCAASICHKRGSSSFVLYKSIVCWIHAMASTVKVEIPETIPRIYTARVAQHLHEKVMRYFKFCVLDSRCQTTQHWTALISFMKLCELHSAVFFTQEYNGLYADRRELRKGVLSTTSVNDVKYYDPALRRVSRLIDLPGIKTIGVLLSQPNTFNARAVDEAHKKYAIKNPTKLQSTLFVLRLASLPLQYTMCYKLLKDKLKLRETRLDDPIKALVIAPPIKKKQFSHHIYAAEHGSLINQCFTYKGTEAEALTAWRLTEAMTRHYEVIESFFALIPPETELLPPLKLDRIAIQLNKLLLPRKKND